MIAPAQYLLTTADAANLTRYVEQGGTLVVSFFSGIVDENDAVHAGGYGAPLRDALGVRVEEFLPLRDGSTHAPSPGTARAHATLLRGRVAGAPHGRRRRGASASSCDGPGAGMPAITRHRHGAGVGWYVSTRLDAAGPRDGHERRLRRRRGRAIRDSPKGVEVITRRGPDADFIVAINHRDETISLPITGRRTW